MVNYLKIHVKPYLKIIKLDILYYFLLSRFFVNRIAVTVEKDLSSLPPPGDLFREAGLRLVAITPESVRQDGENQNVMSYPTKSKSENRYAKAVNYLDKGYRGFALVRGNEVCGDIWYVGGRSDQKEAPHPDLKWLRIQCANDEVYAFDMHLYPEQRGKNMAVLLQSGALHELKRKGFKRAFGYYWAKYLPALWVHRTLQWKELGRIKVSRLLFISHYTYEPISRLNEPSVPGLA